MNLDNAITNDPVTNDEGLSGDLNDENMDYKLEEYIHGQKEAVRVATELLL